MAEQYERNMQIVAQRIRRVPWSQISKEHGCTIRRCQEIFEEWRDQNPTLRHSDPQEIVDELLYGYQSVIEDFEKLATTADQDSARVGALNGKLRAFREMAELLQAIGALPNDLGTLTLAIDGRITAERIVAVLDRFDVSEEVEEAMLMALGGPTGTKAIEGSGELVES